MKDYMEKTPMGKSSNMSIPLSELNFTKAVQYHYHKFPPVSLDYKKIAPFLSVTASAIARFDQMLKNMHNRF